MALVRGTLRFLAIALLITQRSVGDPYPGWKNGRYSGETGNYHFGTSTASRGPVRSSEVLGSFDIPPNGYYGLNQPINARAGYIAENNIHPTNTATRASAFKSHVFNSSISPPEYNAGIVTFNNVPPTQTSSTEEVPFSQIGSDFTLERSQYERPSFQVNNQEMASYDTNIVPASTYDTSNFLNTSPLRSGRYNRPSAVGTVVNKVSDNTSIFDSEFDATDNPNTSSLGNIEEVELSNKIMALTTNQDNAFTSRFNSRGLNSNRGAFDTISSGGRFNPCGPGFHFGTQNLRGISDSDITTLGEQTDSSNTIDSSSTIESSTGSNSETTVESVTMNSPKVDSLVTNDVSSAAVAQTNVVQQPSMTPSETVSFHSSSTLEMSDISDVQQIPTTSPETVSNGATDQSNAIFVPNTTGNFTPNIQQGTIGTSDIVSSDSTPPSTALVFENNAGPNVQQAPITSSDIVSSTATLSHNTAATFTPDIQAYMTTCPELCSYDIFTPAVQETQITNPGTFNYGSTDLSSANFFLNAAGTSTPLVQQTPTTGQVSDYIGPTDPSGAFVLHNTVENSKPIVHQTPVSSPGTFYITSADPSSTTAGFFTPNVQQAPITSSDIVPSTATLFHNTAATFTPDIQNHFTTCPEPGSYDTFTPAVQQTQITNPGTLNYGSTDLSSANFFLNAAGTSTPLVQQTPTTDQVTDYIGPTDPSGAFVLHNTVENSKPIVHQTPVSSPGTFYITSTDPSSTTAGFFTPNVQQAPITSSDIVPSTATIFHNTAATFTPDIQNHFTTCPEPGSYDTFTPAVQQTQITKPGTLNYGSTDLSSANFFLNAAGTSTPLVQQTPTTDQVTDYIGPTDPSGAFVLHNTVENSKPIVHQTPVSNPGTFYITSTDPSSTTAGFFTPNIQQAPITSSDIVPSTATLFHNTPGTFTPNIQKALIISPEPGFFTPVVHETQIINPGTFSYGSTNPSTANVLLNTAEISTPVVQAIPMNGQVTDYIGATNPSGVFVLQNIGETSKPIVHQTSVNNPGTFYFTSTDSSNTPTFPNVVEMSNPVSLQSMTSSPKTFYFSSSDPSSDAVFHIAGTSSPVLQETSMTNPVIFHFSATDPSTAKIFQNTFGTPISDLVPTEAVLSKTNEFVNDASDIQTSDIGVATSIPDVEPSAETNSETASSGVKDSKDILPPDDTADKSDDAVSYPAVDSIEKVDTKTFESVADIPKSEESSAPTISPEADSLLESPSNSTALNSTANVNTSNTNIPDNVRDPCSGSSSKDFIFPLLGLCSSSAPPMTQLKTFSYSPVISHVCSNSTTTSLRGESSNSPTVMEMVCIETVFVAVGSHCKAVPSGHSSDCTVLEK